MSPRKKDSKKTQGEWVTKVETVTPEIAASVVEAQCSWKGCKWSVFAVPTKPAGWKHIIVGEGSMLDPMNVLRADVDGNLCPEHYRELLSYLAIGPLRLKQMEETEA